MEATTRWGHACLIALAATAAGCWPNHEIDHLKYPRDTLRAVGRRLSQSCSEQQLTTIASRANLLLSVLTREERSALAHGYLRFRVDSPVVVDVAVPVAAVPFWIADQGFQPTKLTLENIDTSWSIYRKNFQAGVIGLGVNGLDRRPPAHYAVFVRPLIPDSACRRPAVHFDGQQPSPWKITQATNCVSAAHDAYKPFKSLPPELIDATMLQPAHADRHSALLATGRVWKTHVVSSADPDQVTVSYGSNPARELVWTWRTSAEVTSSAIRIARDCAGVPGPITLAFGDSTPAEAANLLNDAVTRRHRVSVDCLEPDTTYRYSLGDGRPEAWSPWHTVKTGPGSARGARFLYLGDAQTGLEGWGRLLHAACERNPVIDCILLAGDLVDRGNERTNWDHFFLRGAGVFDRVPLMPCVGNHEYLDVGPRLYRTFFELPRNGPAGIDTDLVYWFECGGACVAVLDSTLAVCDSTLAKRQADWLDEVLSRSNADWKLVMFHHPVYPSHPWRDSPELRRHWVPVFDKHHVDLVLQGHDHAYQRTHALRGHRRVGAAADGTTYLIAVSGDKFVQHAPRDYIEVGFSGVSTYQTIDIDASMKRLTYRAWTEAGTIVDELVIDKSPYSPAHGG